MAFSSMLKVRSLKKVKIGIFKCGNIGTAPLLELLFDELADREDISVQNNNDGSENVSGRNCGSPA
jgi:hypothetical protein